MSRQKPASGEAQHAPIERKDEPKVVVRRGEHAVEKLAGLSFAELDLQAQLHELRGHDEYARWARELIAEVRRAGVTDAEAEEAVRPSREAHLVRIERRRAALEFMRQPGVTLTAGASQRTRDAAEALGVARLHQLLRLDSPDIPSIRAGFVRRTQGAKEQVELFKKLRDAAMQVHTLLEQAARYHEDGEPNLNYARWEHALAMVGAESPEEMQAHADNIVRASKRMLGRERADVAAWRKATPRRDDKGTRANTKEITDRLVTLRKELRRIDKTRWTVNEIAELILSSTQDLSPPPCSALASTYSGKSNELVNWINTRLSRGRRRS